MLQKVTFCINYQSNITCRKMSFSELPTSTFFKGKYGSMFLFDKIHVVFLFQLLLLLLFYWRVKVLKFTHIIYVMKNWSEFLNKNVQK